MATATRLSSAQVIRDQFREFNNFLEGTISDVRPEQVHWQPPGTANPIGASYAHVVVNQDMAIQALLKGGAPLAATTWAGKVGISEPAPMGGNASWYEWGRRVKVDLPAIREYAQAVYKAADEHLASLDDDGLARTIDLEALGFGKQSVAWVLLFTLQNTALHCGEIACMKGLQGGRGYPV